MKYFEATDRGLKRKVRFSSSPPTRLLGLHLALFIPEHFDATWGMDLNVKQAKSLQRFLTNWIEKYGQEKTG